MTEGERELIAAHVSRLNGCTFCQRSHAAVATTLLNDGGAAVSCVLDGSDSEAALTPRMRALVDIASRVQVGGRSVTQDDVDRAKAAGASEDEIHDTVVVAAFFCFVNRYVDGLGTETPEASAFYEAAGDNLAKGGYRQPNAIARFFVRRMLRKRPR